MWEPARPITSNVSGSSPQTVGGTFANQYIAWEILGGIDYPLAKIIDLRIIEVGGGKGYDVLGAANSNLSLFTVNSGLVVHF
jgi:hypothetical protein